MRRLTLLAVLLMLLTACGGGGVRQRVNPPSVSVQQLALQPDGNWNLLLRVQNYSNVSMRVDSIEATLGIAGADAAHLALRPALDIAPGADVIEHVLHPSPEAAAHVQAALDARGSVAYSLRGTIRSSQPDNRRDEFTHESQLSAVPGLAGVMR